MRIFLLLVSVFLTCALYPATYTIGAHNGRDGQPAALLMVVLCLVRGLVLTGAGIGFGWAVLMEVSCVGLLLLSIDGAVMAGFRPVFGALAFLASLAVVAGSAFGIRRVVLVAVWVLVLARAGGWAFYGPLTAAWRAERISAS